MSLLLQPPPDKSEDKGRGNEDNFGEFDIGAAQVYPVETLQQRCCRLRGSHSRTGQLSYKNKSHQQIVTQCFK